MVPLCRWLIMLNNKPVLLYAGLQTRIKLLAETLTPVVMTLVTSETTLLGAHRLLVALVDTLVYPCPTRLLRAATLEPPQRERLTRDYRATHRTRTFPPCNLVITLLRPRHPSLLALCLTLSNLPSALLKFVRQSWKLRLNAPLPP